MGPPSQGVGPSTSAGHIQVDYFYIFIIILTLALESRVSMRFNQLPCNTYGSVECVLSLFFVFFISFSITQISINGQFKLNPLCFFLDC